MGVTAVLAALVAGLAFGAAGDARFARDGISIRVPEGWRLTTHRINGVLDPVSVFTVSTFRFQPRPGSPSSGVCSAVLRRAWRPGGAYVQLTEERDGASRTRMLRHVPHRPRRFKLDAKGWGGLCTPPDSGEFSFQSHGRAFYVFYGFDPKASMKVRAAAAAMLDNMQIRPRR